MEDDALIKYFEEVVHLKYGTVYFERRLSSLVGIGGNVLEDLYKIIDVQPGRKLSKIRKLHIALYYLKHYRSQMHDAIIFNLNEKTIKRVRDEVVQSI